MVHQSPVVKLTFIVNSSSNIKCKCLAQQLMLSKPLHVHREPEHTDLSARNPYGRTVHESKRWQIKGTKKDPDRRTHTRNRNQFLLSTNQIYLNNHHPHTKQQWRQMKFEVGTDGTRYYVVREPSPRQPPQQHVVVVVPISSDYRSPNAVDPPNDPATQWASSSFSDKRIRHKFIQKVYLILTALLLVTLVCICIFLFVTRVKRWVQTYPWVVWISIIVYIVASLVLICCESVRRSYPANYICLGIFNLAFSYVCAAVSTYYSTQIVMIAIGITALVCVSISIFAIQTKIDFTLCAGLLFVLSMVLMIFGLVVILVFLFAGRNYILTCVYGAVVALVMSLFLMFDTQMVIGGRKYQLSEEDYIVGALILYTDVATMFLVILSFFSYSN